MKKAIASIFIIASVTGFAFAQGKMTYVEIGTNLTSIKSSAKAKQPAMRNYLIDLIRKRGVDKPLTADFEDILRQAGATDELIEAIRENSPPPPGPAVSAGTVRKNSIGMELVYVPAGEFMMGSSESDIDQAMNIAREVSRASRSLFDNEKPQHRVTISNGFWMGRFEVTQGQWQAVMGDNPSAFNNCGADCPVEMVSWDDIQIFLRKLNEKNDGFEYSLPTEAQWEYAARAGTTGAYGGTGNLDEMGWYYENSDMTPHHVGQKHPNAFGLYDMNGNVREWCEDWYGRYSKGAATDPKGAVSGKYPVSRGGSYDDFGEYARSAYRYWNSEDLGGASDQGFRVAARPR